MRRTRPHRLIGALLALMLLIGACAGAATSADPELREQYLVAARTAGDRAGLQISDREWLELGDLICERQLLTDADYDNFVREMEEGAPNPALGRVMKDVGRTAIALFCPV